MNEIEKFTINSARDIQDIIKELIDVETRMAIVEKKQDKLDNYGWFALGIMSLFTLLALGLDKFIEKVGGLLLK